MSRSPAWSLLSSFKPSFLFFFLFLFFFKFYFGLFSPYIIHTLIQTLLIISSLPLGGLKNFFNISGRRVAGRSSDLLGRACVCMCWWSLFTSSVSLHSYPLSSPVQLITTFSFLAGAALLKKVSYFSIHSSHSLFSIPVVTTNSLFLSLCSLLVELLDSWGLSTTKTVLF